MALLVALVSAPAASASGIGDAGAGPLATGGGSRTDAVATRLEGIDVSHWQNTIDWSKVAAAGKSFAIIKATESTDYTDPLYATNHMRAKAAGLWTGAYHFAQPSLAANDAILEADYFVSVINLGAHDLIPALDLEHNPLAFDRPVKPIRYQNHQWLYQRRSGGAARYPVQLFQR